MVKRQADAAPEAPGGARCSWEALVSVPAKRTKKECREEAALEDRIQRFFAANFRDLDQVSREVKMVNGLTLLETIRADHRAAHGSNRRFSAAYVDSLRRTFGETAEDGVLSLTATEAAAPLSKAFSSTLELMNHTSTSKQHATACTGISKRTRARWRSGSSNPSWTSSVS